MRIFEILSVQTFLTTVSRCCVVDGTKSVRLISGNFAHNLLCGILCRIGNRE